MDHPKKREDNRTLQAGNVLPDSASFWRPHAPPTLLTLRAQLWPDHGMHNLHAIRRQVHVEARVLLDDDLVNQREIRAMRAMHACLQRLNNWYSYP